MTTIYVNPVFEYFSFGSLLGLWPAWVARRKGYDFVNWWVAAILMFPVALLLAMRAPSSPYAPQKCPDCSVDVAVAAAECSRCGAPVPQAATPSVPLWTRRPIARVVDEVSAFLYRR